MTIEAATYEYLAAELADSVGSRIFPAGDVPQETELPFVCWQRLDAGHKVHQDGRTGLIESRYVFTCVAKTQVEAQAIADALMDALAGYRGTMGTGANAVEVRGIFLEDHRDEAVPPTDASERGAQTIPVEFRIWYQA